MHPLVIKNFDILEDNLIEIIYQEKVFILLFILT